MEKYFAQTLSFHNFHANSKSLNEFSFDDEDLLAQTSSVVDVDLLKMKYKQGNSRVYHDFFKTKICNLYLLNICKKGDDCPFAHSEEELREKPNLYKTKLCQAFLEGKPEKNEGLINLEGNCNKGANCCFAHGESELRSTPDLFKTAICNLWTQGKCNAGERCRFAHGFEDLRPAPSHHKQKKNNFTKPFNNRKQNPNFGQGLEEQPFDFSSPFKSPQVREPFSQNSQFTGTFFENNNQIHYVNMRPFCFFN